MKNRLTELTEKILLILYAANRLSSSSNPLSTINFIEYFRKEWGYIDKKHFKNKLYYLEKRKFLKKTGKGIESAFYKITSKGLLRILRQAYLSRKGKEIRLKDQYKMIMFDVPEERHKHRDKLRKLLKEIGFKELQKSVFIGDYDMEKEIDLIIGYLGLREFVITGHFIMEKPVK